MAIEAIDNGHKYSNICIMYGIPKTSLRDHISGKTKSRKMDPKGLLTKEEESTFYDYIGEMAECSLPMILAQVKLKMAEMIEDRFSPFKERIPRVLW